MTDMTPKQIKAALDAGIIDETQASALRVKTAGTAGTDAALIGNEEDMRFLRSFSDVFIGIGVGILALGLLVLTTAIGPWAGVVGAAVMWMQAEYFGRKKRAHFPTLVSALWFLAFVHIAAAGLLPGLNALPGFVPAAISVMAMLVFYWRFRLPFSIALIAISLAILLYSLVYKMVPIGLFSIVCGLAFFAGALAYDTHDTDRKTRFADNAFWLHFTAAPMILHGIALTMLAMNSEKIGRFNFIPRLDKGDAIIMLCIIGVLALVGLAVNRRALLVSSFGYAAFSIAALMRTTGIDMGSVATMTLILLGAGIVLLGAGWHGARGWLLKLLPSSGIFGKIFPPVRPD